MARIRKSTVCLTQAEWDAYNNAINELVASGRWQQLYMFHANRNGNHRMHGSMSGPVGYGRFLYWHRVYLILCENALREVDDSITIPYWDWIRSEGVPEGLNHMPIRGVSRNTGTIDFTDEEEISQILENDTFDSFVFALEVFPHNRGHNWVGGIMSHPMDSPMDPFFYIHHANVDRIFALWQALPGNADKKPQLSEVDQLLDPWEGEWNIDNVHNTADLGDFSYEYAPDDCSLVV